MEKQKQTTTAEDHLRALLASLNRDEHWSREQYAAVRAAEKFLINNNKGK